jgi:opacity protein-like surface antigen
MHLTGKYLLGLAMAAGLACGAAARADQNPLLVVSAGTWETLRDNFRTGEVDVDYRFGTDLIWKIRPHIGLLVAGDGDYYGYGGFVADLDLAPHLVLTLNTAIGGYGGHGYNLGSNFEFRNGAELAYRFENDWRIGFGFYHISNAGITRENGGSESALVAISAPMPW